jgi:hypothetical protein
MNEKQKHLEEFIQKVVLDVATNKSKRQCQNRTPVVHPTSQHFAD